MRIRMSVFPCEGESHFKNILQGHANRGVYFVSADIFQSRTNQLTAVRY